MRRLLPLWLVLFSLNTSLLPRLSAAEETPSDEGNESLDINYADQLPRIAPHEPSDALATFETRPSFRIEQVAAEPLVFDPVAMAFDADGRLYVVEMRDYSEQEHDRLGRVRLLEDTDGDGRFDTSSVFVDGLSWPTAITCYDGGAFVGAAPEILYCKDTDGDKQADVVRTAYTGFERSNVQGLLNTLTWGLDNRIHGATSSSGGNIIPGDAPDAEPVVLRGRDFAFDPRGGSMEPTSGGGQHGLSFDRWGRKFVSSNSDHIQLVMFEDRYVARNPYLAAPAARLSIAADGPQAEVFRISPVEPWRIVRTRLRAKGIVPGIVEGGGRPAGYFTGATGVTIYRGHAWPEEYQGNAFIGDVGSNIVHRKVLDPAGVELIAHREKGEEAVEFVASNDIWFRPCQFANAPDGNLYILDVYREVIEHPASLPPIIKQHLDLTSGRDRGRVYRVVRDNFEQGPLPQLSEASTAELVALLEHPNGWHRETAARLLYERHDRAAIEPLRKLAASSASPEGRMHALYALDGLDALTGEVILARLADPHPRVRQHAVRLAERVVIDEPLVELRLTEMVDDDDPLVRYQLAFTLGELSSAAQLAPLVALAKRDAGDRWMRLAIQSSLVEGAAEFVRRMADDDALDRPGTIALLTDVATQIAVAQQQSEVAGALRTIEGLRAEHDEVAKLLLQALSAGLAKNNSPLQSLLAKSEGGAQEMLVELVRDARRAAVDEDQSPEARADAIRSLALGEFDAQRELLASLLASTQPQDVQLAAIDCLGRFESAEVADILLAAWQTLSPRVRGQAAEVLFARPERLASLLAAVEAGDFATNQLDAARLKLLREHRDSAIRERALAVLGEATAGRRQDVVESYQSALAMEGDPERGRAAFRKVCAACHKLEGNGHELGPNLAAMQNRGPEAILVNVLDPNREVNPQFMNYVVLTADGRSLTGMITAESANSLTLTRAEGQSDTVLRIDIDELQSTSQSLMPEGMEKEVDPQTLADVIAYLTSLE